MSYTIYPVGSVHRQGDRHWIEIFSAYREAMLGLENFSDIYVLYWFHKNDAPGKRATLRVHPRRNPANPLTGIFGTHSPARPNLIGLSRCRILGIDRNLIRIDKIDAMDGSPVIDIKGFIPDKEPFDSVRVPNWV